jgi:glycosyltransferase involved in cell wall biosynthesis
MKKVLIVITKADWAGAQRVVYEITNKNKDKDIVIDVAMGGKGPLYFELLKKNINVIILNHLKWDINPLEDLKGVFELKNIIKQNKYNVVHLHSTKAGFVGRLAAKLSGVKKIIYTVHGWWGIERFSGIKKTILMFIEKFCAKLTTDIVFICERDKNFAIKNNIGSTIKYRKITNQIEIKKNIIGCIRNKYELNESIKIIGNIGRLDKTKNPQRFINIAEKTLEKNENYFFIWIGDGNLKKDLKIKRKDKIIFTGFIKEPYEYLIDFDLLLLTSIYEGMPITILEAFKYNIPVLATPVGGIPEFLSNNNIFDSDEKAINKILRKNFNFENNYPNNNMVKDYLELYKND